MKTLLKIFGMLLMILNIILTLFAIYYLNCAIWNNI